jgi:hypothetical protein
MRKLLDDVGGAIVTVDVHPHEARLFTVMGCSSPTPSLTGGGAHAHSHEVPYWAFVLVGKTLLAQGNFQGMEIIHLCLLIEWWDARVGLATWPG